MFVQMCQEMGFLLVALGLSGAIGQVFIFVTIAKFGALTCSIIGLARKITTLVASIYFYGHALNKVQFTGLVICIGAMVNDFFGKKGKKKGGHGHGHGGGHAEPEKVHFTENPEEQQTLLNTEDASSTLEMGKILERSDCFERGSAHKELILGKRKNARSCRLYKSGCAD